MHEVIKYNCIYETSSLLELLTSSDSYISIYFDHRFSFSRGSANVPIHDKDSVKICFSRNGIKKRDSIKAALRPSKSWNVILTWLLVSSSGQPKPCNAVMNNVRLQKIFSYVGHFVCLCVYLFYIPTILPPFFPPIPSSFPPIPLSIHYSSTLHSGRIFP